jgi:uncharacterized protein YcbK (DUF882 family)
MKAFLLHSITEESVSVGKVNMNRRRFVKLGALTTVGALCPVSLFAEFNRLLLPTRHLSIFHIHTEERLDITYCNQGQYSQEALTKINHILRDHYNGEVKPIDVPLIDFLSAIAMKLEISSPFHIISGYRSPTTNGMLRKSGRNVARNSLHMQGKAVDISLPGCDLLSLRQTALDLNGGGVGYYPYRNFIHVDTGRVRFW